MPIGVEPGMASRDEGLLVGLIEREKGRFSRTDELEVDFQGTKEMAAANKQRESFTKFSVDEGESNSFCGAGSDGPHPAVVWLAASSFPRNLNSNHQGVQQAASPAAAKGTKALALQPARLLGPSGEGDEMNQASGVAETVSTRPVVKRTILKAFSREH